MTSLRADLISPLDMFKIGIGPSSSHTVGPMVAALSFRQRIADQKSDLESSLLKLVIELYGSLSATGKGHGTDGAVCAGIIGLHPKSADPDAVWQAKPDLEENGTLDIDGLKIDFRPSEDIHFLGWFIDDKPLPHPNTMRFLLSSRKASLEQKRIVTSEERQRTRRSTAFDQQDLRRTGMRKPGGEADLLIQEIWLSVGGGFVESYNPIDGRRVSSALTGHEHLPYPYNTAAEFVEQCHKSRLAPWQIVIANQEARGMKEKELRTALDDIIDTMDRSIERGLSTEGILPGGLNVKRRAKHLFEKLKSENPPAWAGNDLRPSVYAMAVNEENAAGGKVVTAPTNGASGLIPAVWRTLKEMHNFDRTTLQNGLIVASVIGALVKVHASISGAEVGCQGEVGTSCAMAAGGAVAMLGGNVNQVEQAAEIGIEHHLGMTCDPIMGLVQVPCIERNAMGAVKALNAAALSLMSDGSHLISLDKALAVMKQTGIDMNEKYKETSTGGLALG